MKSINIFIAVILSLAAANAVAERTDKMTICHVGNKAGPSGEVYLDDPGCIPTEENEYFCPDAGKIDLIEVRKVKGHLSSGDRETTHTWDGISDYLPGDVGASGVGNEDTDGDGIDEGCEPPETTVCPCWEASTLDAVDQDNVSSATSCSSNTALYVAGYRVGVFTDDEPGWGGVVSLRPETPSNNSCDGGPGSEQIELNDLSWAEASVCYQQLAEKCEELGDQIAQPAPEPTVCPCFSAWTEAELVSGLNDWEPPLNCATNFSTYVSIVDVPDDETILEALGDGAASCFLSEGPSYPGTLTPEQEAACLSEAISIAVQLTACPAVSDYRLKRDVAELAELDNGIKLYSFKYLWSDETYVGVMAQDLLLDRHHHGAVKVMENGYFAVDYARLGLRMVTMEEWRK